MTARFPHGGFDVEMIDLAEVNLPMLDEPHHPRLRQYVHQHTKDWSATIDRADAFISLCPSTTTDTTRPSRTPSITCTPNGSTRQSVSPVTGEWRLAPGPCRCSKQVVTTLKIVPLFESVNIPFVQQFLDPEGRLQPNESMVGAATAMLDELAGGLLSWAGSGRRRPRSASEPPAAAPWHPPSGAGPGCSLRDTRVAAEDGRGRE
jgi:hypothetical protein